MPAPLSARAWESLLAWYFVSVWGSGFLATKIGLQHAAPFTFLSLRFAFGIVCLTLLVIALKPRWPATRGEFGHVIIAGLLMHAVHLGGSHYAQYLGLSAGITAVLLSVQPLLTAIFAGRWMRERLSSLQWLGIAIGLAGVTLIVWHKIDVREATLGALTAVAISVAGVTAGTLYQRRTLVVVACRGHRVPGDRRLDPRCQRLPYVDAARPGDAGHQPDLPDADFCRGSGAADV